MLASALSHSSIGSSFIYRKRSSLCSRHGPSVKPPPCSIRSFSYKEELQEVKQSSPSFTSAELTLPLASQSSSSASPPSDSEGFDGANNKDSSKGNEFIGNEALEKMTGAQLAIYGGLIAGGLYLLESILNSFEALPVLPETLQLVGVLYAILLASRLFQGKPANLTPSPVKAITELVESRGTLVQRTSLELPEKLDVRVLAAMEKLSRERDDAVNKLEVLKKKIADYARVVAEKEALEAVAVQLAQERDEAMSEVIALKQAVDAMSDRMQTVEKTLQQDLEPLKQSSQALETVALQLASERDSALKELSELKKELVLVKCNEEEKTALESLAAQLAGERDQANLENERLKKILLGQQTVGAPEAILTAEQELFLKSRIDAAGLQFIDMAKPYEEQKEEVDSLVSHIVEEHGASPDWTLDYVKRGLEESAAKARAASEGPSNSLSAM